MFVFRHFFGEQNSISHPCVLSKVETPCLQIAKDAKCILPLAGAESLPPALRPPSHQLEGGVRKFKIEYMTPGIALRQIPINP